MLQEEEKNLREAMHDARDKSGVSKYIVSGRDIGPISDDLIDARYDALYRMRNGNKAQALLDRSTPVHSYSDIRDWVEGVVDGFHKGMQFDGLVDRKDNVQRAVSMFLTKEDEPVVQLDSKLPKSLKPSNSYQPIMAMKMLYNDR